MWDTGTNCTSRRKLHRKVFEKSISERVKTWNRSSVAVKKLAKAFDIEQIAGDEKSLERRISIADTNRPGLELAGFFEAVRENVWLF